MAFALLSLQLDAPIVTKALLKHDMEELQDYCGPEILQRLEGLCKAFQQQVGVGVGSKGRGGEMGDTLDDDPFHLRSSPDISPGA